MTEQQEGPPIGASPTLEELNAMLAADATTFADAAFGVMRRWDFVRQVGVDGLTGPPWNLPREHAELMFTMFNYLATPAMVYFGQAAQAEPFPFHEALALVRGAR